MWMLVLQFIGGSLILSSSFGARGSLLPLVVAASTALVRVLLQRADVRRHGRDQVQAASGSALAPQHFVRGG